MSFFLSAIRPKTIQDRLDSDTDFSYQAFHMDLMKFMKHAIRISEALQGVDNGPNRKLNEFDSRNLKRGGNPDKGGSNSPNLERKTVRARVDLEKRHPSAPTRPAKTRAPFIGFCTVPTIRKRKCQNISPTLP